MSKYMPTFYLCVMYIVSVIPAFWDDDARIQNWILCNPKPMAVAWNVRFAASQLLWIVCALMVNAYGVDKCQNKINRTSMKVFLCWCIFDTIAYFYNYKTFGYFATYFWLVPAWLLIHYWKIIEAKWPCKTYAKPPK